MKRKMSITVKGNHHKWSFNFYAEQKYLDDWRKDGLEINEIVNDIPVQAKELGLTKIWFFIQDIFNFKCTKE